jgi:hypothetical protein
MKKLLFSITAIALLLANTATAAEIIAPNSEMDGSVSLGKGQVLRNVYTAGSNVTISSDIQGDLYAAGANLNITGSIEDDLVVAGGTVNLNGTVGSDMRVAGGNVFVNGQITGDLVVFGGNITVSETASIGGDLVVAGGNIIVNAPVAGKAQISGGNVTINNSIGGEVAVNAERLAFGPDALIASAVQYKGRSQAVVAQGAQVGEINFTELEKNDNAIKAAVTVGTLIKLLGLFLAGWILLRLSHRKSLAVLNEAGRTPLENLGLGFVGVIILPILIVVLFFTLIGYYVALFLIFFFILAFMLTLLFAAMLVGAYLMKWLRKKDELHLDWKALLLGLVVLEIIKWIPVIGWLICLVIFLITFGAMLKMMRKDMRRQE